MEMNLAYDLFLLTFNLSQHNNREKIIQLFIEGLQEIFKPAVFAFHIIPTTYSKESIELKSRQNHYGYISFRTSTLLTKEHIVLISNAIQMVAVIIDNLDYCTRIEVEKVRLHKYAERKLSELKNTVKELEDARIVSFNLIEDLNLEIERRKDAERAISKTEKYFRFLIENAPDGVVLVNSEGKMTYASPAARSIFGFPDSLAELPDPNESTHPDDLPLILATIQDLILNPGKVTTIKYRFRNSKGNWLWVESTFANHFADEGIESLVINFRDITERKQLQADKFQLLEIIDKSLNEIYIFRSDSFKFEYANVGALNNLGYSFDEIINLKVYDIKPEYSESLFRENVMLLITGEKEVLDLETFHRRKNGTTYPVEVHLQFYNKDGAGLFLAVINDITERKEAEEKIQLNYALLKVAGKIAKFGGWNVILSENRSYWSDEVAAIHEMPAGYSPLLSEGIAFYASEYRDKITEVFTNCANNGIPYDEEMQILTSKGKRVWVRTIGEAVRDHTGSIVKVQGFFQDITEQKEAQMEIIKRESFLNKVFEVLPIGLWFADSNGKLLRGNPAGVEIWGAEPTVPIEEYGVFKARRLPSGVELSGTDWALAHTIAEGVTIKDELLEIDAFDGKTKVVLNYTAPVLDNNGNMLGAIVVNNEITDRVRANEEIQKLNDELEKRVMERTTQLREANKELEAFSYSVSHDLRAPLRAIHSFTSILREDYKVTLDDEGRRICDIIESSSVHMGNLIDDLLSFSRVGRTELKLSNIDMTKLAEKVYLESADEKQKERIELDIRKLPPANGDLSAIHQVFVNLISNAIKYTSKTEKPEVIIGCDKINGDNVYFVKDNGVGFDMLYEEKLFGVFQRLHSSKEFEGNGVGLAIVQRIIHRHGGRIWAESEVGKGATFFFTLPAGGQMTTK
jgi:PAS domain S-box-containing protein